MVSGGFGRPSMGPGSEDPMVGTPEKTAAVATFGSGSADTVDTGMVVWSGFVEKTATFGIGSADTADIVSEVAMDELTGLACATVNGGFGGPSFDPGSEDAMVGTPEKTAAVGTFGNGSADTAETGIIDWTGFGEKMVGGGCICPPGSEAMVGGPGASF